MMIVFPAGLLERKDLSAAAKVLLARIYPMLFRECGCFMSDDTLAGYTGLTRMTVHRAFKQLESMELIVRKTDKKKRVIYSGKVLLSEYQNVTELVTKSYSEQEMSNKMLQSEQEMSNKKLQGEYQNVTELVTKSYSLSNKMLLTEYQNVTCPPSIINREIGSLDRNLDRTLDYVCGAEKISEKINPGASAPVEVEVEAGEKVEAKAEVDPGAAKNGAYPPLPQSIEECEGYFTEYVEKHSGRHPELNLLDIPLEAERFFAYWAEDHRWKRRDGVKVRSVRGLVSTWLGHWLERNAGAPAYYNPRPLKACQITDFAAYGREMARQAGYPVRDEGFDLASPDYWEEKNEKK